MLGRSPLILGPAFKGSARLLAKEALVVVPASTSLLLLLAGHLPSLLPWETTSIYAALGVAAYLVQSWLRRLKGLEAVLNVAVAPEPPSEDFHLTPHPPRLDGATNEPGIPLPFAGGAIGLFLAGVAPGGLTGGMGFFIGFAVGILLIGWLAVNVRPEGRGDHGG